MTTSSSAQPRIYAEAGRALRPGDRGTSSSGPSRRALPGLEKWAQAMLLAQAAIIDP